MTDITLTQEQLNAILAAFGCTPPTNETPQKELRFTVNLSAALRIGMYGSEAPTASFSYVVNGQDVSFTYTGTGAETVVWNFGDGGNGTVQLNPTHTYVGSGPFTVTLTACNPMGCTTTSQVINLVTPTASFTYTTDGLEVTFTDTSTGATSWSWNFGDGSPADTTQNPVHTYSGHGSYNVTLTISAGADSDMQAVSVNTAFHAAVIAAGANYFYDHQDPLNATGAANSGSSTGNGTYTSVTLEQTGITGAKDAGLYNAGTDTLAWPSITMGSSWTFGFLVKSIGAIGTTQMLTATGAGLGALTITIANDVGGGQILVYMFDEGGMSSAELETVGVLSDDTWTLIFVSYDSGTGNITATYSVDGTIVTPSTFYQVSGAGVSIGGTPSPVFRCNLGASGGLCDGVFFKSAVLTPLQQQAIAESIWP